MGEGEAPESAYRSADLPDFAVIVEKASGSKCERCWKVLEEVGKDTEYSDICYRCIQAVKAN